MECEIVKCEKCENVKKHKDFTVTNSPSTVVRNRQNVKFSDDGV
jgi:hypothetical protein